MLNINELETKWVRYKVKSSIPYFIIFFSLTVIALVTYYISSIPVEKPKIQEDRNSTIKTKKIVPTKQVIPIVKEPVKIQKDIKEQVSKDEKQTIMSPSLNFIKRMDSSIEVSAPLVEIVEEVYVKRNVAKVIEKEKIVQTPIEVKEEVEEEIEQESEDKISIKRQNTHDDIQHVIKRFKQSHNPALSLFAAKKYYELEDYSQAYNYALITNEINNDIEESWIIFTKSLVKLGEKEKAINILNEYINTSHSQRATILLRNIKSGKLK